MMTVNEVSKLTGVNIHTLQYYDTIGLLKPIESDTASIFSLASALVSPAASRQSW